MKDVQETNRLLPIRMMFLFDGTNSKTRFFVMEYRETQMQIDEAILAAIQSGATTDAELKQVIVDRREGYTLGLLVDCFATTELPAAKQRLQARGMIEITNGNKIKPADGAMHA